MIELPDTISRHEATLHVRAGAGCHVDECRRDAIALALELGINVALVHNDRVYLARPDLAVQTVLEVETAR